MNERKTAEKRIKRGKDKRGFTLAELCVVLFLIVLLSTMTVTFSELVGNRSKDLQNEYVFMEQCSLLKNDVTDWICDNITAETGFTTDGGVLSAGGYTYIQSFSEIREAVFSANNGGDLIKCTVTGVNGNELTFVIAVRTAVGG